MTIAIARPSVNPRRFALSIALSSHLQRWLYRLGWHIWSYSTIFGIMALAALSLVVLHGHQTLLNLLHPTARQPRTNRK